MPKHDQIIKIPSCISNFFFRKIYQKKIIFHTNDALNDNEKKKEYVNDSQLVQHMSKYFFLFNGENDNNNNKKGR